MSGAVFGKYLFSLLHLFQLSFSVGAVLSVPAVFRRAAQGTKTNSTLVKIGWK